MARRAKNKIIEWTVQQLMSYEFYPVRQELRMTAAISRIKTDWLRKLIWLLWYPWFVYLPLWWRFRYSKNYVSLQIICWDLGWNGVKNDA